MKGYFTNNRDRLPNNTLLLINHITIYTPHLPATILNLKMNCLLIYPGIFQNTPIKHHSFTENGEAIVCLITSNNLLFCNQCSPIYPLILRNSGLFFPTTKTIIDLSKYPLLVSTSYSISISKCPCLGIFKVL